MHKMEKKTSINPATGEVVHAAEGFDPSKIATIVESARKAQVGWGALSYQERADYLWKAHAYIFKNSDDIARSISINNGKPLVESLAAEVTSVVSMIKWACHNAEKILRNEPIKIGLHLPTKKAYMAYEPIGVVGIISPWNYPLSTPLAEVFLGLMAGNAIILKPSEVTGLVNQK